MAQQQPTVGVLSEDQLAMMEVLDSFEKADASTRANLRSFTKKVPEQLQLPLLVDLVGVDLELRWKEGERRSIKQYLDEFPELRASGDSLLDLLQTEFDLRERAGERPSIDEFRSVNPQFQPRSSTVTSNITGETGNFIVVPPEPAKPLPKQIDKYQIERKLGEGAFGVVYRAYDTQLQRHVAIKVRHSTAQQSGLSPDQLHEARSISGLKHEGIVKVFDVRETGAGVGYVVYEYVDGETMQSRIKRGDYTLEQAVNWVIKLADALYYAHQQKVIHRDIKPANILIDSDGEPRLVDFGLARRDEQFFVKDAGQLIGTAAYMSPEQAKREGQWASSYADLYSLGVVLYELITHKRPFQSQNMKELLQEVISRTPPPPSSLTKQKIPRALEDVCLKALSKDPAARYRNGAEMAQALRKAMKPDRPIWMLLGQGAAALVAVAAVCVLVVSLWPKPAPIAAIPGDKGVTPVEEPTLTESAIFSKEEGDNILHIKRPLSAHDELRVQSRFNVPAFAYVLKYPADGPAEALLLAGDKPTGGPKDDAVSVPGIKVPDSDGAMLIITLVTQKPLKSEDINVLLAMKLEVGLPPAEVVAIKPYHWVLPYNCPKVETEPPETRGGDVQIPPEFKEKLKSMSNAYFGIVLAHTKS